MANKTLISSLLTAFILISCTPNGAGNHPALESVARGDGDAVVAQVSRTEIFSSDVDLAAQEQGLVEEGLSLQKTDARYRDVLEELIDQRLLALDAETMGLSEARDAQIRLAAARERILGNMRVERHIAKVVTETSIRRMYDEQSKLVARGDEVRARHILVEEEALAKTLLKKIQDGGDFAVFAKDVSIDAGSAKGGGDLGYFTQDMLNGRFTRPVFEAAKGDLIGPVKSEFGWHIAEVLDRRAAPQLNFETLQPKITNFMTFDAIQDLLVQLRDEAEIVVSDDIAPVAPEDEQADLPNDE